MATMNLQIVTPERVVYEKENVASVSIPTVTGEITVLPNHIPLISLVQAGEMKIRDAEGEHVFAVFGGVVEVRPNNKLVILADNVERAEYIDPTRAEKAKQRAEEEMKKAHNSEDIDFARLQAKIDREMNRLRVANKYRK